MTKFRKKNSRDWRLRQLRAMRRRPSPPTVDVNWSEHIKATYISKAQFVMQDEVTQPLGDTEVKLEEEVWSKGLPDDVFCTVLAFLPLSSFLRMRSVCKKWNEMAQDLNYLNAYKRVPPQEPSLFLTSRGGPYWAYEPALNAWTCLPASFFRPKVSEGACYQVTAAGSRLLFIRSSPKYSLMVYNPFNKTQRTLPPMFDMSGNLGLPSASEIHVVGMYVDTVQKYYNILVVDRRSTKLGEDDGIDSEDEDESELEAITSQIYDSRTCAWDMVEEFDPGYELSMLNAALFSNTMHCLTISPQLSSTHLDVLVVDELAVYKVLPGGWEYETLRVPTQDQALVAPHIFSTRGRPMLAAAVPQQGPHNWALTKWKCIIIWELEIVDRVEEKWVKLTEIDLQKGESFTVHKDSFIFLSEGNSLYFGSNTGSSLGVINMRTQSWRLLPPFPGYVPQISRGDERKSPPRMKAEASTSAKKFQAFVYEPRFDLVA